MARDSGAGNVGQSPQGQGMKTNHERDRIRSLAAYYVPLTDWERVRCAAIIAEQFPNIRRTVAMFWAIRYWQENAQQRASERLRLAGY